VTPVSLGRRVVEQMMAMMKVPAATSSQKLA